MVGPSGPRMIGSPEGVTWIAPATEGSLTNSIPCSKKAVGSSLTPTRSMRCDALNSVEMNGSKGKSRAWEPATTLSVLPASDLGGSTDRTPTRPPMVPGDRTQPAPIPYGAVAPPDIET